VQIGMDTPQVSAELLLRSASAVLASGAALGMAADGGWWALGLTSARRGLFGGLPMSTDRTGRLQHERLRALGYSPARLETLVDIDTWDDARSVAAIAPASRTAAEVHAAHAANLSESGCRS
jgi:glycosyltransferase A (GT-A) superfamily protein (DUF2064 family)